MCVCVCVCVHLFVCNIGACIFVRACLMYHLACVFLHMYMCVSTWVVSFVLQIWAFVCVAMHRFGSSERADYS